MQVAVREQEAGGRVADEGANHSLSTRMSSLQKYNKVDVCEGSCVQRRPDQPVAVCGKRASTARVGPVKPLSLCLSYASMTSHFDFMSTVFVHQYRYNRDQT
jgi:hypothetical protein